MSQLELSRRTGIATSNISDWKKKKTNPKADCLLSICDALDITPEQLLTGKGIDSEYKDADMDYEVTRSDIKILKQIHSLGDEQYKRLMAYMKALQKLEQMESMMEISEKAFCKKYSDKIVEIPGCRKCIAETDFNLLISDDKELFKKMGMLEVTKVETLRSEIASIISFQPLKFMMAKEYLNMMKIKTGCKSEQQYVEKYEIPKEFDEALQRFMNSHHDNSYYKSMINYLKNKECFDLDKIRELGLDIQYLSSITSDGSMTLEVFVVGKGIFYSVLEDDEGEQWNEIHIDEMGNIKLPYFSYYSDRVEERIINLSHTEVDRDFSKYNTVENIQWCIQNLNMKGIEDYEFDVLGYHSDAIDLRIHTDLLVKMIVPDAIDTIFTDQIIDLEKLVWITDVSDMRVFAQDI